jgi:hypothetical protein
VSTIVAIADAVAAELNAGAFSEQFMAERLFQPVFELQDLQTLHVSVVPRSATSQGATRGAGFFDYAIDIGVQKKVGTADTEDIESLLGLVEAIADHLRARKLTAFPASSWLKMENVPVYSVEHLDQLRQFTSVLTVTYRVMR